MSFAKRISPTNRILEQIDVAELARKYSLSIPLEIPIGNVEGEEVTIPRGYAFLFSSENYHKFVEEVVQRTYIETFEMLKRRMNYEDES